MHGGNRCPVCGEAIGVYERVIAFDDEGQRETSLAREPALAAGTAGTTLVHETCAGSYRPPSAVAGRWRR